MNKEEFSEKQLTILSLLMEKPYIQKDLQKELGISSPGLLYHLNKLENWNFIQKITLQQVGNAKINEISIDPIQLQNIRRILGLKTDKCTLITGFGELGTGYQIPDQAFSLLQNKFYRIDQVVCITTRKAKEIRESKQQEEKSIDIARYYAEYEYNDFRNLESQFFKDLDGILRNELTDSNLIIDITPLSKLYSFEMLKRANEYQLACYYIGKDPEGKDSLIWMTDIHLKGKYS
jgi:DNA-binding MarR family transcriptional regulator